MRYSRHKEARQAPNARSPRSKTSLHAHKRPSTNKQHKQRPMLTSNVALYSRRRPLCSHMCVAHAALCSLAVWAPCSNCICAPCSHCVCGRVCRRRTRLWTPKDVVFDETAKYVAVFDPLDGSSNVDAGIPTGTIFGIFEHDDKCVVEDKGYLSADELKCLVNTLKPGTGLVASGCVQEQSVRAARATRAREKHPERRERVALNERHERVALNERHAGARSTGPERRLLVHISLVRSLLVHSSFVALKVRISSPGCSPTTCVRLAKRKNRAPFVHTLPPLFTHACVSPRRYCLYPSSCLIVVTLGCGVYGRPLHRRVRARDGDRAKGGSPARPHHHGIQERCAKGRRCLRGRSPLSAEEVPVREVGVSVIMSLFYLR